MQCPDEIMMIKNVIHSKDRVSLSITIKQHTVLQLFVIFSELEMYTTISPLLSSLPEIVHFRISKVAIISSLLFGLFFGMENSMLIIFQIFDFPNFHFIC